MLKIKENEIKNLVSLFYGIEKTHFIYFEEEGVRVNKHTGLIEIGNFKYSPYANLGKTRYNIPNIIMEFVETGMIEKVGDEK